jgi:hypothetical protein
VRELAREQTRVSSYRRLLLFGEPLQQNAAIWYRLSLAKIPLGPADNLHAIGRAVGRGFADDASSLNALVHDRCLEAQSARIREALRCTWCDWGRSSMAFDVLASDPDRNALLLGNCIVLSGHLRAAQHQWSDAATFYLEALSFGCDLGQADFEANLVGMAVSKSALEALGKLVGKAEDDTRFLDDLWQKLSQVESGLPSVDIGFRLARLEIASNLEIEAQAYVRDRRRGLTSLLPWRAVAAWRLSRSERLLNLLEQAADAHDPGQREQLAAEIGHQVTGNTSAVTDALPDNWVGAMNGAEYLERVYWITRAAIKLQQWHADNHGKYPATAALLASSLERHGLRYEPSEDAYSYKIVVASGRDAGTVLLEQRRFASPK